jgi:hypothetical protein
MYIHPGHVFAYAYGSAQVAQAAQVAHVYVRVLACSCGRYIALVAWSRARSRCLQAVAWAAAAAAVAAASWPTEALSAFVSVHRRIIVGGWADGEPSRGTSPHDHCEVDGC